MDRLKPFLEAGLLEPRILQGTGESREVADRHQQRTIELQDRQYEPIAIGAPEADMGPAVGGDREDFRWCLPRQRAPRFSRVPSADELSCRAIVEQEGRVEFFAQDAWDRALTRSVATMCRTWAETL